MQNKIDLKGGIKETQNSKKWPYRKIASGMENLRLKKSLFWVISNFPVEELNQNKYGRNECFWFNKIAFWWGFFHQNV